VNNLKRFIKAELITTSPLKLGSGGEDSTNSDLLRSSDGMPFIPATSLAGVLRHYVLKRLIIQEKHVAHSLTIDPNETVDYWFGYTEYEKDDGADSRVIIYDAFDEEDYSSNQQSNPTWVIERRDGVKLNEFKTVDGNSLYDYQVLSTGVTFILRIEINFEGAANQLPNEKVASLDRLTDAILEGLNSGDIRIGGKTTRGFGTFELQSVLMRDIDLGSLHGIKDYIKFDWRRFKGTVYDISYLNKSYLYETPLVASFNIPSFIMIRDYATLDSVFDGDNTENESQDDDIGFIDSKMLNTKVFASDTYEAASQPVIPGTSWAGLFRHHITNVMLRAKYDVIQTSGFVNNVFGYVDTVSKERTKSNIEFSESMITNSPQQLNRTRTAIDRFTGGASETKLFTTQSSYGGEIELKIRWRKSLSEADKTLLVSLLNITINDLANGFVAIGGMTSVGGGILEPIKEEESNE